MFKNLLKSIGGLLAGVWSYLFNSFTHYNTIVDSVKSIEGSFKTIKSNFEEEVQNVKDFKFDPKWKTRVINVPKAIEAIQDLKVALFDDMKGRLQTIADPFHAFALLFKSESITAGDPALAVSSLAKADAKLGEVVTLLTEIDSALVEISDFQDLFDRLLNDLQTLDDLFLQQKNPRQYTTEHLRRRVP